MMLNQEYLERQGGVLSEGAHKNGLNSLTNEQAKTLSLYEDWKDGADWPVVIDLWKYGTAKTARQRLVDFYGYKERP